MMKNYRSEKKDIVIGITMVLVSIILFFSLKEDLFSMLTPEKVSAFVSSFGFWAPVIYIIILVLAIIISQIPNIPLAIAAGTMFGPFLGGLYSLIGGVTGALACFYIARSLGIPFIRKIIGKTFYFCDRCSDTYIGLIIFFSRLFPFFSFDLMSYCAGLANIKIRTFFIATLLGMIPMTFLFSHLGGFILVNQTLSVILSIILIILFFLAPWLIRRFNLLGLKGRILFE